MQELRSKGSTEFAINYVCSLRSVRMKIVRAFVNELRADGKHDEAKLLGLVSIFNHWEHLRMLIRMARYEPA